MGGFYNGLRASIGQWSEKKKVFLFVFLVIFADTIGYGITLVNVPGMASDLGANKAVAGSILGLYSLLAFILLPPLGVLVDRVRKKLVMATGMGLLAFSCLLFITAQSTSQLAGARVMQGIAVACNWGGGVPLFALYASQAQRGWEMSLIGIAYGAGVVLGPTLGGWGGPKLAFFTDAIVCLIVFAGILIFLKEEKGTNPASTKSSLKEDLFKSVGNTFGLLRYGCVVAPCIAVIAAYLAMGVLELLFPIYAEKELKYSLATVGFLFTAFYIFFTVPQPLLGRWSDRVGRVLPMNSGLLVMAIALPLVFLSQNTAPWVPLFVLLGLTLSAVYVPALPFVADGVDEEHQGHAYGLVLASSFLGLWLGPLFGGQIAKSFNNVASSLLATGALLFTMVLIFIVAKRKGPALA